MPPIITAFNDDETFDEKGMRTHVNWLIENGVHGMIPTGSTGEFITMDIEERKRVINVAPVLCRKMYDAAAADDVKGVYAAWDKLFPLIYFTYNGGVHWLQVVKTSIHMAGRPGGPPRRPTTLLTGERADKLRGILEKADLL